jgi:hypothetical protein
MANQSDRSDASQSSADIPQPPSVAKTNDDSSSLLFKKTLKSDVAVTAAKDQANEAVDSSLQQENDSGLAGADEKRSDTLGSGEPQHNYGDTPSTFKMTVASGSDIVIGDRQDRGGVPLFDIDEVELQVSDVVDKRSSFVRGSQQ